MTPHIAGLQLEELRSLRNQVRCTWLRHESLLRVTTRNRALLPWGACDVSTAADCVRNSGIADARRIVECSNRRKLVCTPTRSAERHPQGVCRIRKTAEPPTAAQQRVVEAETNRLATPNAATPRYGQCNRQALQLFELLACNVKTFLLGDLKGAILFCEREWPPLPRAAPAALLSPPRPTGAT